MTSYTEAIGTYGMLHRGLRILCNAAGEQLYLQYYLLLLYHFQFKNACKLQMNLLCMLWQATGHYKHTKYNNTTP